jgi:hypothetical protein
MVYITWYIAVHRGQHCGKPDTRKLIIANLFAIRHQLALNSCIGCRGRTLGFLRSSNLSSHVRRRVCCGLLGRKATIPRQKLALHVVAVVRVIDRPAALSEIQTMNVTGTTTTTFRRRTVILLLVFWMCCLDSTLMQMLL